MNLLHLHVGCLGDCNLQINRIAKPELEINDLCSNILLCVYINWIRIYVSYKIIIIKNSKKPCSEDVPNAMNK